MSTPTPGSGIQFDKTINLGHVISMIMFLAAISVQWNMVDKRITVLEESRAIQRERDAAQDVAAREKAQEIKETLRDVKSGIEKISDRLTNSGMRK
jgi:hypothetical protein